MNFKSNFSYIFGFVVLKNILIDLEVYLIMKALKLLIKVKVIYFEKKMMNGLMIYILEFMILILISNN